MNEAWSRYLATKGAAIGTQTVAWPGGGSAPGTPFVCDLSDYGLLDFSGPDAEPFLHAQLSSDVRSLPDDRAQLATYNTPKGRVLATMLLWRSGDGFLVQVPAGVCENLHKRLSMYILRSRVRIDLASERVVRVGLGGTHAAHTLAAAGFEVPGTDYALVRSGETSPDRARRVDVGLRLPGNRYELVFSELAAAIAAWEALCAHGAAAAGIEAWQWLGVRSGIVDIVPQTQEQFVAQMLNLELLGGVSFNKGCYPGQEIVARSQYRGEIKRRTFLAHVESDVTPQPAAPVFSSASPQQAIGSILTAAPAPTGGYDVLACLHVDLAGGTDLHVAGPAGPRLQLLELPYKLPVAT